MSMVQPDIIHQLRQEILLRQGFKPPSATAIDMGLGPVAAAFPNGVFPAGAMHELLSDGPEGDAAASAFVAVLVGRLMARGGACIWIGPHRTIHPPALKAFGVEPDRVIFVDIRKEKEGSWAVEEALKCEGLAAVVGEVREVSFLASRRFQLAVEQSRVTGFLLRDRPRNRQPIATVARWKITPLPGGKGSVAAGAELGAAGAGSVAGQTAMPGVGFPRWSVELLRMRSGQPGKWELEWREGKFHFMDEAVGVSTSYSTVEPAPARTEEQRRKTG
jgi:protein ImuA